MIAISIEIANSISIRLPKISSINAVICMTAPIDMDTLTPMVMLMAITIETIISTLLLILISTLAPIVMVICIPNAMLIPINLG